MTVKYNRFALIPHTCYECERAFIFEPYKRIKKEEIRVVGVIVHIADFCKNCGDKHINGKDGE